MKNLDFALKVLREVQVPIRFSIVGPPEDTDYWKECQQIIENLPRHIVVDVLGGQTPEGVTEVLSSSDVLLLPTLGENFGHAIAEALTYGCVPLISDRTPWGDLEGQGAGFIVPLEQPERFIDVLNELGRSPERLHELSAMALRYAQSRVQDAKAVESSRQLFQSV